MQVYIIFFGILFLRVVSRLDTITKIRKQYLVKTTNFFWNHNPILKKKEIMI